MTGAETIIMYAAKYLSANLAKWGYKKVTEHSVDEYSRELYEIISKTQQEYERQFPIEETDKIPFYKSQTLIEQFLAFRFTKKLDEDLVKKAIEDDKRIIAPTRDELQKFFELFDNAIESSPKIKALNISINYKEEVFSISESLRIFRNEISQSIKELQKEIRLSNVSNELIQEWNKQLDEILEDIKTFKAQTAKKRLELLEQRIAKQSISKNNLSARLFYLKAECLNQLGSSDNLNEQAQLLIKVYKLQPFNQEYKANAGLAYMRLNEIDNASNIAEELLQHDEFNITGWVIRCIKSGEGFKETLKLIPEIVRNKNEFKIQIYQWLNHSHFINRMSEVKELNLKPQIDFSKSPKFTYRNMHYQYLCVTYLLNKFYDNNPSITNILSYPNAKNDIDFKYAFEILKIGTKSLAGTEIEKSYLYYLFQYHCCSFIINENKEDVYSMESIYESLADKRADVVVRMVQGYNSLFSKEGALKAAKITEEYTGHPNEILLILNVGNYAILNDKEKKTKALIKYIDFIDTIDRYFFLNFILSIRYGGLEITDEFQKALNDLINKTFEKPEYKYLIQFFCFYHFQIGNYLKEELIGLIEKSESLTEKTDKEITINIAFAYCLIEEVNKAKLYLKEIVDLSQPSELLKLYCKVLYKTEGEKVELLNLLKNWRENHHPDYELLQIEFVLRQVQNNWSEAIKIAKLGVDIYPNAEFFINGLFVVLNNAIELDDIKKYAYLVKGKQFQEQIYVNNVSQALIRAGLFADSLELLYSHAIKKSNAQCRQAYITLSINYPRELLKEYEEVAQDTFVKYVIKGKTNSIHITEENKNEHPYSLFIGKKVGDTFPIQQSFTDLFENLTILRVTDKYIALLEEIFEDAKNPISGLQIHSFEFGDGGAEALQKVLIENFGTRGTIEKQRVEQEYEKYYNGLISFAEITNSVFKGHFTDAYFILSHQQGKPFKAISPVISPKTYMSKTNFILDFTSLCLFYQLEKENGITFQARFLISSLIREQVVRELEETKLNPAPELSVSITMDKVTPHFYDDNFQNRRLNTFQTILNWIDKNCIVEEVPERLNYVMELEVEHQNDLFLNILIDNRLLADRQNCVLLTNDTFYYRFLQGTPINIVSPLRFLENHHTEDQKKYMDFMLSRNYVGIPISSTTLNDEFFKMLSGQENRFSICLENLRYNWNPDNRHINESINFIKGLYVSAFINKRTRTQTVFTVFQNLIVGMHNRLISIVFYRLRKEFELLGAHLLEVTDLFKEAVKRN